MLKTIKLREWQSQCLSVLTDGISKGKSSFSVVACPGSGKTVLQAAFASYLLERNQVDCIINVVPSDTLRSGNAAVFGSVHDIELSTCKPGLADTKHGFSTTYQMLTRQTNVDDLLAATVGAGKRFVLIADEVHHGSTNAVSKYGNGLDQLIKRASFSLLLSGTMWRTDGHPIAGVSYTPVNTAGISEVSPDFVYTLQQATDDGVVLPVYFTELSADIAVKDQEQQVSSIKVNKDQPEKHVKASYRHLINPAGSYCRQLLEKAVLELDTKRKAHALSGSPVLPPVGLVVTATKDSAEKVSRLLQLITGTDPVVVHGDRSDSKQLIEQFRDGLIPNSWMVSVGMVSEGVDIPRIKVLAYLTNARTELVFHQIIGRSMRVRTNPCGTPLNEDSSVFLPAAPDLHRHVTTFSKAQSRVVGKKTEELRRRTFNEKSEPAIPDQLIDARVTYAETFLNGVQQSYDDLIVRLNELIDQAKELLKSKTQTTQSV